ncbi:MAG TPA: N-acetylmuramoyl-L-alanine amidase, partial [Terriglobales bacterium]|nr:N-acetylmuramoyl-L-alanine amidase [Terriglobales bacterium]
FVLPNPWRIMVEVRPKHPPVMTAQQKQPSRGIVAQPFALPNGQPGSTPAAPVSGRPAARDEAMVVVVPMNLGHPASAASESPADARTISPVAAAPHPARGEEALHNTAAPHDAPAGKPATLARRAAADDPARTREAQPTSMGERSLTRALGLKIGRIVIDAGHGGHDTGAVGPTGYREKDLVLDVALRLGKLLDQKMGAEVVYTRDDDTFIPLEERTNIANHAGADLFVSVHANFSGDPEARGVETYYLNFSSSAESLEVAARENASSQKTVHELQDLVKNIALKEKLDESREFAADVQHALWAGEAARSPGIRNRGVKQAPFIVLIGAHMPSILAEISFVSNAADERRLRTPEYRQRIAESLYRGISRYVSSLSGVKVAAASPRPAGTAVAATPSTTPH